MADFIMEVFRLKDLERSGWVERNTSKPESVGDHSFMTAFLSMLLAGEGVDRDKAVRMALIHDIAESRAGDIMLWQGKVSRKEKYRLENEALEGMLANASPDFAREAMGLWKEFERQESAEARFVRDMDKLDMLLQAVAYSREGRSGKGLEPFFGEVGKVKGPEGLKVLKDISELKDYLKGR